MSSFAAGSLAAFGLLGAVAVMVGLVFFHGAVQVALERAAAVGSDAATVLLMWELHDAAWTVGSLFFGLWLIPMGYLALTARMPRPLGWILITGGVGYILSGIVSTVIPDLPAVVTEAPTWYATLGEFWIIGYLLSGRTGVGAEPGSEAAEPHHVS